MLLKFWYEPPDLCYNVMSFLQMNTCASFNTSSPQMLPKFWYEPAICVAMSWASFKWIHVRVLTLPILKCCPNFDTSLPIYVTMSCATFKSNHGWIYCCESLAMLPKFSCEPPDLCYNVISLYQSRKYIYALIHFLLYLEVLAKFWSLRLSVQSICPCWMWSG